MVLPIAGLFMLGFFLGALPLPQWLARAIARRDLSRAGTGNVSVAAAFKQVGPQLGVPVVLVEIARGVVPVLVARAWFPEAPAWQVVAIAPVVLARYAIARGGGVTNSVWGMLAYSPGVALGSGLSGWLIWQGLWRAWGKTSGRARRWGARLGCASAVLWTWPISRSLSETLAVAGLAFLLVGINLRQADDADTSMSLFVLDTPLDAATCGAKAARLSLLKRHGFTVPDGWVVSADTSDLDAVASALAPTRDRPLIVRSSAIGEDGDTSSAAGQYLSVGPVETHEEFIEAIRACRESYRTENAIAYRHQRGLPDAEMALLVQPYRQSRVSGVAFSRHPLDGAPFAVIEALPKAAAVVAGQQTPEHLEILRVDAPDDAWQSEHLPPNVLKSLVEQVARIEALFHGIPQDVEWLWDGDRLWILQTRPISNLNPIWTRTIAAEVIPGAIRPLTWSINQPLTCGVWGDIYTVVLADRAEGLDFSQTATLFGSHAYFNATLLGEIFRLMGLPEQGLEFLL
ncbi:MAG: glycerol-3-phosphate acyltransferase, partial [Cyanobacteria bacterium J06639_1]